MSLQRFIVEKLRGFEGTRSRYSVTSNEYVCPKFMAYEVQRCQGAFRDRRPANWLRIYSSTVIGFTVNQLSNFPSAVSNAARPSPIRKWWSSLPSVTAD